MADNKHTWVGQSNTPSYLTFAKGEADLGEIWDAARDNMIYVDNVVASQAAHERAYDERINAVKQATGVALENPYRRDLPQREELEELNQIYASGEKTNLLEFRHRKFARDIEKLAINHPDKTDSIGASAPIADDAYKIAREAGMRFEELAASRDGPGGVIASFAGGVSGALRDPFQLSALALGAGPATARTIGGRIVQTALSEAAINAGIEAAMQPVVQDWREQVGLPHGWSEAARNVLFAGGLGGVFGAGGRGIAEGASLLMPKIAQDAPIRQAVDDPEQAAQVLEPVKETLDAPSRGAMDHMEIERAENIPATIEHDETMGKTLARVEQPDLHEPVLVDKRADTPLLPPRGIDDPADAKVEALTDALVGGERAESSSPELAAIDGAPVMFDPDNLQIDAKRFQFKEGGDEAGVTNRLAGIKKWQPERSGVVIVWEAKDGTQFIADGHQRSGLAKRIGEATGEKIRLPGYIYREADGFSDVDVRKIAALKNIAEGSGSALDAAKILRSGKSEDIANLPPSSALVRDASGLARLSDDAFTMAVNELVKPHLAAVVGRMVDNPQLHADILQVLKSEKASTIVEAESMVRDLLAIETVAERQDSLFGSEEVERMLLKERARVLSSALNTLKKDKQVFAMLTREEGLVEGAGNVLDRDANAQRALHDATLIEYIEKLVNRKGPVADAFNAAARKVSEGEKAAGAARDFVAEVRKELERVGDIGFRPGQEGRGIERADSARSGEGQSETGVDNKQQLLIDGVESVRGSDRLNLAAEAPLTGGNKEMDIGMFGPDRDQLDMLVPEAARQDIDGELVSGARPLVEVVKEAEHLNDLAELVRSCKT